MRRVTPPGELFDTSFVPASAAFGFASSFGFPSCLAAFETGLSRVVLLGRKGTFQPSSQHRYLPRSGPALLAVRCVGLVEAVAAERLVQVVHCVVKGHSADDSPGDGEESERDGPGRQPLSAHGGVLLRPPTCDEAERDCRQAEHERDRPRDDRDYQADNGSDKAQNERGHGHAIARTGRFSFKRRPVIRPVLPVPIAARDSWIIWVRNQPAGLDGAGASGVEVVCTAASLIDSGRP